MNKIPWQQTHLFQATTYNQTSEFNIHAQESTPAPDDIFPWPTATKLQWLVSLGTEGPKRKADLGIVAKPRKVRRLLQPLEEERSALKTKAMQEEQ